uniref:NADH dehydrogenase subunit 3 n=1 Tax=Aethus nigritus TaxID=2880901 RepID=UPI001D10F0D8|nr:NADH dehydrogenase subunit 3 [Aethus nigritus]UCC45902.1 NADH dehydrogenase subunit 3 [Aethus nigritus]
MMKIIVSLIIVFVISIGLMSICTIISMASIMDKEKMSPFECGFNPMSSPRMPFSIQFFLIAVLFLIFDIEIVIILPIILTLKLSLTYTWIITTMLFLIILMLGLYYEWMNGMLEWAN